MGFHQSGNVIVVKVLVEAGAQYFLRQEANYQRSTAKSQRSDVYKYTLLKLNKDLPLINE